VNSQSGLSLIEIAMGIIVIGLLMMPVIQSYEQQIMDARGATTQANFYTVQTALQQYFYANNYLPCPADITANDSSATYGQELRAGNACGPAGPGVVLNAPANTVIRGGVPFAALDIPVSATLDGWSNKIAYVVTMDNADSTPGKAYNPSASAITVDRFAPSSTLPPPALDDTPNIVPYTLVSYGDDGVGAYSSQGTLVAPCPVGAAIVPVEAQNCDPASVIFRHQDYARSLAAGTVNYFDDLLSQPTDLANVVWGSIPKTSNIFSSDYIGVGISSPAYSLDVNGNVLASTDGANPISGAGNIVTPLSGSVCDASGNNCFPVDKIGGNGMGAGITPSCPTGSVMTGIAGQNGANPDIAICEKISFSTNSQTCPPGKPYVMGFDAGGNIVCGP